MYFSRNFSLEIKFSLFWKCLENLLDIKNVSKLVIFGDFIQINVLKNFRISSYFNIRYVEVVRGVILWVFGHC